MKLNDVSLVTFENHLEKVSSHFIAYLGIVRGNAKDTLFNPFWRNKLSIAVIRGATKFISPNVIK